MIRSPAAWARPSGHSLLSLGEATSSSVTLAHLRRRDAGLRTLCTSPQPRSIHGPASLSTEKHDSKSRENSEHEGLERSPHGESQGKVGSPRFSSSSSPLYPNSKASFRLNPNARSPLFVSRLILDASERILPSEQWGSSGGEIDEDLPTLQRHLRNLVRRKAVGDVETVVGASNYLAQYWATKEMKPTRQPYDALLEVLSFQGMLDECYEVLEDIKRLGWEVDRASLNWTLKAAVLAQRQDDVLNICQMIDSCGSSAGDGQDDANGSTSHAVSEGGHFAIPALISTRNFNLFTYTCLFQHCLLQKQAEQALFWFTALVKSRSTSVQAFQDFLRPSAVQYLVETLLSVQEYRLAVEIAEWIHLDSAERLVFPKLWADIAAACAEGHYYPGLKHSFKRAVTGGGVVTDEGFLLAALGCASRAPNSDFCFELLKDFLLYSTQWVNMRIPDTTPPPVLQHPHLMPLVEALIREGKYEEAIRLMGAFSYWGLSFNLHTCAVLEKEASLSISHLKKAIAAWQHVLSEGTHQTQGEPEPITSSEDRVNVLKRVAEGKIPALAGRVAVYTMNSLIEAAARLGEDDLAMGIWEDRRLARLRPSLSRALSPSQKQQQHQIGSSADIKADTLPVETIHPTIETFNSLLKACLLCRLPSVSLADSIFNELRTTYKKELSPNAKTYEYLIRILLNNPTMSNSRLEAQTLSRCFSTLEECKNAGLTPTSNTYEAMIRACLRGSEVKEDVRWGRLMDEMLLEAEHPLTKGLATFVTTIDRNRRKSGRGVGLTFSPTTRAAIAAIK